MGVPAEKRFWVSCSVGKPSNSPSHVCSSSHVPHHPPGSSLPEGAPAPVSPLTTSHLAPHMRKRQSPPAPKGDKWTLVPHPPRVIDHIPQLQPPSTPASAQYWMRCLLSGQGQEGWGRELGGWFWGGRCNAETAWRGRMVSTLEGQEREVHSLKKSAFVISAAGGTTFY